MLDFNAIPAGGLRKPVSRALRIIERRYLDSESFTSIHMAPRVGKSDIPRALAMRCDALNCPCVFALSPWTILVEQGADSDKAKDFLKRIGHASMPPLGTQDAVDMQGHMRLVNNERLIFGTYAWAITNLAKLVPFLKDNPGCIIFADECQFGKSGKPVGDFLNLCASAGAHVVSATGSMFADMPGFRKEMLKEKVLGFKVCQDVRRNEDDKLIADLVEYSGTQTTYRISADVTFTQGDAWASDYACTVDHLFVKAIGELDGEAYDSSTMTQAEARTHLYRICKDPRTVTAMVNRTLQRLALRKEIMQSAKAIIYTCADVNETVANAHANMVKESIDKDGRFRASIAVLKQDGNILDPAGKVLKAFRKKMPGEKWKGVVCPDILIVKAMGGVGLDVADLKTVCDLSNVRSPESALQKWLRGATLHESFNTYDLILLDEPLNRLLYEALVKNEGGESKQSTVEELSRTEIELDPDDDGKDVIVTRLEDSSASDNDGNFLVGREKIQLCEAIFSRVPELQKIGITRASLDDRLKGFELSDGTDLTDAVVNTTDDIQELSKSCEGIAKSIVKMRGVTLADGADNYGKAISKVKAEACRRAGFTNLGRRDAKYISKKTHKDISDWKRYEASLQSLRAIEESRASV